MLTKLSNQSIGHESLRTRISLLVWTDRHFHKEIKIKPSAFPCTLSLFSRGKRTLYFLFKYLLTVLIYFSPSISTSTVLTNFGSSCPSGSGFIDSLHNARNTRNASFCKMCVNLAVTAASLSLMLSCDGTLVNDGGVDGAFCEPTLSAVAFWELTLSVVVFWEMPSGSVSQTWTTSSTMPFSMPRTISLYRATSVVWEFVCWRHLDTIGYTLALKGQPSFSSRLHWWTIMNSIKTSLHGQYIVQLNKVHFTNCKILF